MNRLYISSQHPSHFYSDVTSLYLLARTDVTSLYLLARADKLGVVLEDFGEMLGQALKVSTYTAVKDEDFICIL